MNKKIDINLYKGTEPMLVSTGIAKEIKQALGIKVNLPCGGYLYIQTTEALTVVDVNSGKFVSSSSQEETILKTNLEAVDEIARQLRLRNIGGMVIIDFIDMLSRADKIAVMERLELALEKDKAKPQVGQLSDLGLVELTRHRQGQSISEMFSKVCPHCQGTGYIIQDFNFASSSAEGEYRSKVAKAKVPTGQFNPKKKFNKFSKNNQENIIEKQENNIVQQAEEENYPEEQIETINIDTFIEENMQNLPEEKGNKKHGKNKKYNNKKNNKQNNTVAAENIKEPEVPEISEQPVAEAEAEAPEKAQKPASKKSSAKTAAKKTTAKKTTSPKKGKKIKDDKTNEE